MLDLASTCRSGTLAIVPGARSGKKKRGITRSHIPGGGKSGRSVSGGRGFRFLAGSNELAAGAIAYQMEASQPNLPDLPGPVTQRLLLSVFLPPGFDRF
jgi:hypothetical protein